MDASTQYSLVSNSPGRTRDIAARIGRLAYSGLVITLAGDLGSGKTCFVQGLARGLEVPEGTYVTSPSYTLVNTYQGRLTLHHVDLYRLSEGGGDDIGIGELLGEPAVTAIEWPQRMAEEIPEDHLAVVIGFIGEGSRRLDMTAYGLAASNLVKDLRIAT